MSMLSTTPKRDILLKAYSEIVDRSTQAQLPLRLTGSIAVQLRCPHHAGLVGPERRFEDLDLVARKQDSSGIRSLLENLGYAENREIFVASEGGRAIFDHPVNSVHIDVFFDQLDFCHVIDIRRRLDRDGLTLPLAELLLGKLQIVKINAKDFLDASILLIEHKIGDSDGETINAQEVATRCAAEWGLWRTVTGNLEKLIQYVSAESLLTSDKHEYLKQQVETLKSAIDVYPKPLSWRMRAKVGDRLKWYRDVEEVDG